MSENNNQTPSIFPRQAKINEYADELVRLMAQHEFDTKSATAIIAQSTRFRVRVPLVGAFSCGKTSLLNGVLPSPMLPTAVTPETSLPVELHYAGNESLLHHIANGSNRPLTREQLATQEWPEATPNDWVEVALNAPNLTKVPHLVLVDMPGWDSGIAQHAKAIDQYLDRSLAYCLVVSVDEGSLQETLHRFLAELAVYKKPYLLVITKSDKKPQSDVQAVLDHILDQAKKVMGQAPLAAIAASARKDTEPFLDALQRLEDRAEERFEHAIVKPLGAELKRFALHLHKLLNEENLDLDTLKQEAERLHKTFDQTSQRLTRSHETLESELATRLPRVVDVVRHGLTGEQDTLARRALQGRDISSDIGLTIRRLISQGVEQEIKPVFQRHLSQSAHLMAENWGEELELQVSDLSRIAADVAIDDSIDMEKLLIQILTILLPKMPTLLKLVSVIGPFLQKWFNDKQAEVAREKQLEELRQEIIQRIIPEVLSQLQTHLNAALQRTTGELQGLLEQELEEQYQRHQQTIAQLQRQVQASEEEQQRRNAAQRSALEFVRTLDDLLAMDAPQ